MCVRGLVDFQPQPGDTRPVRRLARATAALTLTLPLLTACSDDQRVSTAPVIEPGRPGESATVHPPGTEFTPVEPEATAADVAFIAGMIPHHEQALEMAELAPDRASHDSVLGLASRIADVQGAEIDVYVRWLSERGFDERGLPVEERSGDHSGDRDDAGHADDGGDADDDGNVMHGMATEEELARLERLRGTEFDRRWLELMIEHHEGAVRMAEDRLAGGGVDVRAGELAADVVATQLAEIRRMEAVLADLTP